MRKRWIVLPSLIALAMAGGAVALNRQSPEQQARKAIEQVATRLDGPLPESGWTGSEGQLALPDNLQELDWYAYIDQWRSSFDNRWIARLERAQAAANWPGEARLLARPKGDVPDSGTTKCPELNNDQPEVTPESLAIFYCVNDPTRVPKTLDYQQGTLWIPVAELMRLWREVHIPGARATHAQQVSQAAYVHLVAAFADALPRQIRAHAKADWDIDLPVFEQREPAILFAHCVAGVMGRGVFGEGPNSVVADALPRAIPAQPDPVLEAKRNGLRYGFTTNSLGACIRTYWPVSNRPA